MTQRKMKTVGYSQTPLAQKLGIKHDFKIMVLNQPNYYFDLFTDLPSDIRIVKDKKKKKNLIHYFTTSVAELNANIKELRLEMEENGALWISWPKKAAKMQTDLNENVIRDIALKTGLVDVKVCAVDEVWSGLKLVIRLKDRK